MCFIAYVYIYIYIHIHTCIYIYIYIYIYIVLISVLVIPATPVVGAAGRPQPMRSEPPTPTRAPGNQFGKMQD